MIATLRLREIQDGRAALLDEDEFWRRVGLPDERPPDAGIGPA
jgi:hypothetical protein